MWLRDRELEGEVFGFGDNLAWIVNGRSRLKNRGFSSILRVDSGTAQTYCLPYFMSMVGGIVTWPCANQFGEDVRKF